MDHAIAPVLDADGGEVLLPDGFEVTDTLRQFMAGRVPAPNCPHYMHASERRAGFRSCEGCGHGARTGPEVAR